MSSVVIVIPTITGREKFLKNAIDSYSETMGWPIPYDHAFHIVKDKETCGEVWNYGAKFARDNDFEYIHMTADDLIPHPGWYECAVETIEAGYLPCAKVFNPDGSVQVQGGWHHEFPDWEETGGGSVPFCRTQDWIDIPDIHYWSDNAYDYAQQYVNNWKFVARDSYAFTHHNAESGRKGLSDVERNIFEEWKLTL